MILLIRRILSDELFVIEWHDQLCHKRQKKSFLSSNLFQIHFGLYQLDMKGRYVSSGIFGNQIDINTKYHSHLKILVYDYGLSFQ